MTTRTSTANDDSDLASHHSASDHEMNKEEGSDSSPPPRPSGTLRVLARGNACLCCRRRKLKCDGVKPYCTPCSKGRRVNECLYEEAKVKTKTQLLQSRIRELEAKVKRMADREKSTSAAAESPAAPSPSTSSRRKTLPMSLHPASASLGRVGDSLRASPTPMRTDSLQSSDSLSLFNTSSVFSSVDALSWNSSNDFAFGTADAIPSIPTSLPPTTSPWPTAQLGVLGGPMHTSNWNDLLPQSNTLSDLLGIESLGGFATTPTPAADPTSSAPTIAPASLANLSTYIQPPSVSSSFSSSPSLSHPATSSVSSPPSSTWDDDVRLAAFDITRGIDVDDVPPEIARELLQIFLRHRRQCMFEVNIERFLATLDLPPAQRPHPCLINAIYLLGCHFAQNSSLTQYENIFLARTRKGINRSLENADRLINFLQASTLLAWYFSFKGRLLEAHYHASAAARFAMSCGLHLLKVKADGVEGTLTFYYPAGAPGDKSILPQPEDSISLAERINLFWSVFQADRNASIGTGLPVVIRDEDIETPWPRRFEEFELNDLVRFDSNTLRSLYTPGTSGAYVKASDNLHAIRSKAMALNERATRLASQLEADPRSVSSPDFWPMFDSIDKAIMCFLDSLPPIQKTADGPRSDWLWEDEETYDRDGSKSKFSPTLILAHTAALGAVIQLHRMFSQNDLASYKRCLCATKSAMKIVHELASVDPKYLQMALGLIWTTVAEVLAVEYGRQTRLEGNPALQDVRLQLTTLFTAMRDLRQVFPILTLRITKVPLFQGCYLADKDGKTNTCMQTMMRDVGLVA